MDLPSVSNQASVLIFAPLVFAAIFTLLNAWLLARNATKNAEVQNDLATKRKLADFRQAWLNELRDCLSELQSIALVPGSEQSDLRQQYRIFIKVRLLMNKKDQNYDQLNALMHNANIESRAKIVQDLISVSQDILKTEWDILKRDLKYSTPLVSLTS
jgi:lipid A disaccharide synthetase